MIQDFDILDFRKSNMYNKIHCQANCYQKMQKVKNIGK